MTTHPAARHADDRELPLRERKKLRTRRALADTALRMFLDRGFEATTVDDLVDAAEVSKRTFYAHFASKEDVALAAELELWDAYVDTVTAQEIRGPILDHLRRALCDCLAGLGEDWARQFRPTRGLVARNQALRNHSLVLSMLVQDRLVEHLETQLGIDSGQSIQLRLLGEMSLGAWRCAAKNWIAGRGRHGQRNAGSIAVLIERVNEAFSAIPSSLTLSRG